MGNHEVECEHCGRDRRGLSAECDGRRCLEKNVRYVLSRSLQKMGMKQTEEVVRDVDSFVFKEERKAAASYTMGRLHALQVPSAFWEGFHSIFETVAYRLRVGPDRTWWRHGRYVAWLVECLLEDRVTERPEDCEAP